MKNGHTVLDALAGFYVTGGGFRHTAGGERNDMATEQGYYALAAYYRFLNGQTRLYDMSDVAIQTGGSNTPATGDTVTRTAIRISFPMHIHPFGGLGAAPPKSKAALPGGF